MQFRKTKEPPQSGLAACHKAPIALPAGQILTCRLSVASGVTLTVGVMSGYAVYQEFAKQEWTRQMTNGRVGVGLCFRGCRVVLEITASHSV
jgi:hypothetical protein